MTDVTLDHFKRATADVGAHGDNDVLPFDIDNRFIAERQDALAAVAFTYGLADCRRPVNVRAFLPSFFCQRSIAR